jgi:hypothetical protein
MPIQTNCALETAFFHVPIPATLAEVRRLNAIWNRQPPRNGRIVATHTKRGMILEVPKPVVMFAIADEYWRELGRLVKRTGEPWWDLCAIVSDSEPQRRKPHAHALSLYRITAKGELHDLHSDTPEALWPEQSPPQPKRRSRSRSTAKLLEKWQFSPDLLGIFNGPRDLSMRKGRA